MTDGVNVGISEIIGDALSEELVNYVKFWLWFYIINLSKLNRSAGHLKQLVLLGLVDSSICNDLELKNDGVSK